MEMPIENYFVIISKIFLLFYRAIYYTRSRVQSRDSYFKVRGIDNDREKLRKASAANHPLDSSPISLSSVFLDTRPIDCFVNGTLPIKDPSSTFSKFRPLGDPSRHGSRLIYRSTRWESTRESSSRSGRSPSSRGYPGNDVSRYREFSLCLDGWGRGTRAGEEGKGSE